ncbi:MAG: hypothetical protein Q8N44_17240 [Rubrivivax sp.]|nr:hypothetical protein [Rubrivivax sp.]MDP3085416.1 hypothetical protein [Rubrivivax sp.]
MSPDVSRQCLRWERMQIAVRCGLHAGHPSLIRIYLGLGQRLARQGLASEAVTLQRMLRVLLATADDVALPWFWRSACLEHVDLPMARLVAQPGSSAAAASWQLAVQAARERLPPAPDTGRLA